MHFGDGLALLEVSLVVSLALMVILNYAQEEKPHKSIPWILIGIILVNVLILSYTAHLGGMIRRPDLML